jgi:uncharacterized SAM-binding protein YcdF (DUF218 family)
MKLLRIFLLLIVAACLAVAVNLFAIPTHNTGAAHFDAIIVLGYPAKKDGTASPEQRERVLEGVREYKAGVASHLIVTGSAAHNRFVEADVMAALAREQGVPAGDIFEERQALNTIQNVFYSAQMMHEHGWSSAEVISTPEHLPRAAMILAEFDKVQPGLAILWRTHAAKWPREYGAVRRGFLDAFEAARCLEIRVFGFPESKFLPRR